MAHIPLPADQPGVIGPLMAYPETEKPLDALTNVLMTGPSSLSRGERELIAAYVSRGNECRFCTTAHAAVAKQLLGDRGDLVDQALTDVEQAQLDPKLRALLAIAEKVRRDGRLVSEQDVALARQAGADDQAIHDAVLVAALFCLYNRYVDGLATWTPDDPRIYNEIAQRIVANGYGSRFRQQEPKRLDEA